MGTNIYERLLANYSKFTSFLVHEKNRNGDALKGSRRRRKARIVAFESLEVTSQLKL